MKALIVIFLFLLSSCSIYNIKEHSPSVLFSTENLKQQPKEWKYYLHDTTGWSFETVSVNIRENTLEIVPVKKKELEVPESLSRSEFSRQNEIHVYIKEADLLIGIPMKLQEEDIEKVVTYVNPDQHVSKNEKKDSIGNKIFKWLGILALVFLVGMIGFFVWFGLTFSY